MKKLQLLPIGSVVLLEGAEKRLMICGRIQTDTATGTTYDYSGCLYPDGIIDSSQLYMFNNESIKTIFFVGFQDPEEFQFRRFMEEQLSQNEENRENEPQ